MVRTCQNMRWLSDGRASFASSQTIRSANRGDILNWLLRFVDTLLNVFPCGTADVGTLGFCASCSCFAAQVQSANVVQSALFWALMLF
jgi:hypothetical protein